MKTTEINRNQSYILTEKKKAQSKVYNALKLLKQATNRQVANLLGWEINRVTGRVKELREAGYIDISGSVYDKDTNRTVTLFSCKTQLKLF